MSCACSERHQARRIVITGGPGAGKTAVLELIRKAMCKHVHVLPESAGILFRGGFPRSPRLQRPVQRAIFHVQCELEATVSAEDYAIVLCDRGTIDGLAYWPGPDDMLQALGTTIEAQQARYHAVIHLRTPPDGAGYNFDNPLRIESPHEAAVIDEKIAQAWQHHPRRFEVPATTDFIVKATRAIELVQRELPACCLTH